MVTSLPKEGSPLPPLIHPEKELKLDSSLKRSTIHGHGPQRQSYLRLAKDVAVLGGPLRRSTFPEFRVSEVSKPPSASSSQPPSLFPSIRSFPKSRLSASGGQSIGASASVLPVNIQGRFPLELIGLILLSKGLSSLLQHHNLKASILWRSAFFMVQVSYPYKTIGKPEL